MENHLEVQSKIQSCYYYLGSVLFLFLEQESSGPFSLPKMPDTLTFITNATLQYP